MANCKRYVIDGYIGVGKSTLIKNLSPIIKEWAGEKKYFAHEENLEEWENYHGENLLYNMYKGKSLKTKECVWLTRFQTKAISDIAHLETKLINREGIFVQERDLTSIEKVFMPLNKNNFHEIDYYLLKDLIQSLKEITPKKERVFLYGDKHEIYQRMIKRGRLAERTISLQEYIAYCEAFDVLKELAAISIDVTNATENEVASQVSEFMKNN